MTHPNFSKFFKLWPSKILIHVKIFPLFLQDETALLQDRLFQAQGGRPGPGSKLPFQTIDVQPPRMESGHNQSRQPTSTAVGPHSVPNATTTATVSNPYQRTQPAGMHLL